MRKEIISLVVMLFLVTACASTQPTGTDEVKEDMPKDMKYEGKKVLFIDSYHEGYAWSDGITKGIQENLADTGVELKIHRMDTKRNTDEAFKKQAALDAKAVIEEFGPDVVIACDDNGFNYLIKDHYKDAELPFVYCGVNWDSSVYGAPYSNTAGMVEVSLTTQLIEKLSEYADGSRVGFLSGDTVTEKKVISHYENLLGITFEKKYFVLTYDEWKEKFLQVQGEVDILILENNAGISDWDDADAKTFVLDNIKVPTGSTYDWMVDFNLISLVKLASEQGEYSAQTALRILDGEKPADIPEVKNKKGGLYVNMPIADKLGLVLKPDLLKNAEIVQ